MRARATEAIVYFILNTSELLYVLELLLLRLVSGVDIAALTRMAKVNVHFIECNPSSGRKRSTYCLSGEQSCSSYTVQFV